MSASRVKPGLLRWACNRSRIDEQTLQRRFPQLAAWLRGDRQPTHRQLDAFAKATHTPVGYLFLPEPPHERLPLPDFRTLTKQVSRHPSPNLLDTIYAMPERQAWLRESLVDSGATHVVRAALEGRIGFKQTYDLTGLQGSTFQECARRLGATLP